MQVIDAAAHVFSRFGYHGAGMRAIAEMLGIKVASLYTYFRSKDEALEVVCRAGLEQPMTSLRLACEQETRFEERVHRFLAAHHKLIVQKSDYVSVYMNERRYLTPEATVRINAAAREMRCNFDRLFDDARAEGKMDTAIPSRMARLMLIGVLRNITQFFLEGPVADIDKLVWQSGEHFVRGLAPRPDA
ncbi:TetR/AcrR family transcriptional regulator [Novosphingobium cyanobacteriorum]|uniref:TetR/AcrR family transcriptional regulator n=1 Tax=Novosphingobium cyanobacteriorum TaxID=3024215 RepID=A0ABT6CL51_9SPHN|nr:TetR/AcrR family transcriptional regulator [Novosphingobium cyanobacteriorum]MDF8334572.1 TetR/AcrR family transcriptional regulator [Novosphingobium cyanobacteriorum]